MFKFSICNELFEGWNLEKTFKCIAALGYNGVEIAPYTIAETVTDIGGPKRSYIRELAKTNGLEVAGIHWVLKGTRGLHLTSPDPEVRQRTTDYLKHLAKFCGEIGGKVIVFGSPDQRSVPVGVDFAKAWGWAAETFSECAEYASGYDVTICMEPLRWELTNFVTTVDEALKIIKDVDHKNFQLILDVYSMSDENKPIDTLIAKGAAHLRHFHANDDNKRGPGFGNADYTKVVKGLKSIGYKGFVSVEILTKEDNPETAAKTSIQNLRKSFTEE
jgi:sugar phosphate isomerase/epimerase